MRLPRLKRKTKEYASSVALNEARNSLAEVKANTEEVLRLAASLRTMRERNHFAEQFSAILDNRR